MHLSILIPTIETRRTQCELLMQFLISQYENMGLILGSDIEILVARDNKEISIGAKRQLLLEMAKGEYIVFIDDDDWVSDDYIRQIYRRLIVLKPDTIGFNIECSGTKGKTAQVSNTYDDWADNVNGFDYVRTPYQKSPIKREIALQIGYKDMRFAEDYDYSKRLKQSGLIKSEVLIHKTLYFYRYKWEDPKSKYGG